MKQEENICGEEISRTGHAAEAGEKTGPSVLGKFKSADALAEAYSALQAEFTRRSQRLKELERKADNSRSRKESAAAARAEKPEAEACVQGEGAQYSEARALSPETERGEAEACVRDSEPALPHTPSEESESSDKAGISEVNDRNAAAEIADGERGGREMTEDELYKAASRSEAVRLKIVGDYLLSLKSAEVPLMRGGTGTLAAPPQRAKSIADAGDMALRYFRKDSQA